MAAWNRLSKRTALAVLVGLAITSSEASAGVNVIDGAWVTGFLPFSEAAGIVDNRIMLGPADADSEIEAGLRSPQYALFLFQFSDYAGAGRPSRPKEKVL